MEAKKKGDFERELLANAVRFAGVDEVGKGCIAGPVFAGCVVLDFEALDSLSDKDRSIIRDSKTLSIKQKQKALEVLSFVALERRIGYANVREIELLGIQKATFLAMRRAVAQLSKAPELLLIDGNRSEKDWDIPQRTIVKGDKYCFSIAAASIIAKTSRDQLMSKLAQKYPQYGFEKHVGYGTKFHRDALREHGFCDIHRRNFAPISQMKGAEVSS